MEKFVVELAVVFGVFVVMTLAAGNWGIGRLGSDTSPDQGRAHARTPVSFDRS